MNYDMKESGKRIRQLRIQNGFTQEKTANALSVDQSFYARIESGKKGCSVDLFIQLCGFIHTALVSVRRVIGLSNSGQIS